MRFSDSWYADDALANRLFPFSSAARVHDGIFPASQASVYEFSGSVGPRPVSRQLTCAAALQHQRVEQVSWQRNRRNVVLPPVDNKICYCRFKMFLDLKLSEDLNPDQSL